LAILSASAARAQTTRLVPSQYSTIGAALDAASAGDTVLVSPGVYQEHYLQVNGVTLRSVDGPAVTIIDAQGLGRVLRVRNYKGLPCLIEGFTIANGRAPDYDIDFATKSGGGILMDINGDDLTVDRCVFVGNAAGNGWPGGNTPFFHGANGYPGGGGGAIALAGNALITNCLFLDNRAGNGGKGEDGADTDFGSNAFDGGNGGDAGDGGAIYSSWGNGNARVYGCTFSRNRAGSPGEGGSGGNTAWPWSDGDDGESGAASSHPAVDVAEGLSTCVLWDNTPATQDGVDPMFDSDFALLPGSPYIDAISDWGAVALTSFDIGGNPRSHDDPGSGPALVDRGAFEYGPWLPYSIPAQVFVDLGNSQPGPDGSIQNPYPTIAQGAANIPSGQFLGVIAGSYSESILTLSNHMIVKPLGGPVLIQ